MCLCSRGVLLIQIRYFGHSTILYKLKSFIANFFVMRDILIATCSRCERSVGDDEAPETWPFLWNLSQSENPRVVSGGGVRGESAPRREGGGYQPLLSERQSFVLGCPVVCGSLLAANGSNEYTACCCECK
jgi:hypothetical protein